MSIPRFHCPTPLDAGQTITLPDHVFHHAIRVRRLRVGEPLVLFAGDGSEADATLIAIRRDVADVRIDRVVARDRESPLDLTLLQGISAGDRMDYTLQKAVELGVRTIVPINAARSQRLADARAGKRIDHWREVVISACGQSGRNTIPSVAGIASFADAVAAITAPTRWLLSGGGTVRLRDVGAVPSGGIALLAGPEGGFTNDEERVAIDAGFVAIALGPRILRTETAAVAALAAIQVLWGDG